MRATWLRCRLVSSLCHSSRDFIMASANARKRKRVAGLSPTSSRQDDTTTNSPGRTDSSTERDQQIPPVSSRTRGGQARPACAAPNANSRAIPFRTITTRTSSQMSEGTDPVIPEDCCTHCLTRGGNAAYECHKDAGKELCTRCFRDKKKTCRLPTAEESVAIAARCLQCTRRGFKTCNGKTPCDTCTKHKTKHLCRKPSEKKEKLEKSTPEDTGEGRSRRGTRNRAPSSTSDSDFDELDETVHNDENEPVRYTSFAALMEAENKSQITDVGTRARRSCPRVSYTEQPLDIGALDQGQELYDDESDVYMVSTTDGESDKDTEPRLSEDEISTSGDDGSSETMLVEDDFSIEEDEHEVKPHKQTKGAHPVRIGKGIDQTLPPLSNIEACISDMTGKALELGLPAALGYLKGRPIKVATMCSGTESPLLALNEISKALEAAGHSPIHLNQEFSAEIEVFKQAFIERNFHPKILFRDVRDFIREPSTKATTAYGAEVDIPSGIDILVAGFVCKDLSRLNNQGKSLEDGGETGDTWLAVYTYAKRFRPSIVLLENVKATKATWEDVVRRWDNIGYEAEWTICDTKNYYLPQTRERMYMVAIKRSHFGKGVVKAATDWKKLMQKLERKCSSPYEAFLPDLSRESSGYSNPRSEPDWAMCKVRYDHIRSEKRLGILSPISRRSDNGTIMPPDFADHRFYNALSSRVWDAIDIAHLEASQKGYDSLYKMSIWDVSQNVDRFKTDLGIAPCLTPSGQDFASNRQFALSGSQLLLLQGMPLSRLLIANETQKELQNLAGNAMSTTVIGASLISAIISGHKAFQTTETLAGTQNSSPRLIDNSFDDAFDHFSLLSRRVLEPTTYEQLDIAELLEEAQASTCLCSCEGKQIMGKAAILTCSACGHSACTSCAGNPKHVYQKAISRNHRTQTPAEFIRRWRPRLPARLEVGFMDIARLACDKQIDDPIMSPYLKVISEAQISSQFLCLDEFCREHKLWKVKYSSPDATVELRLGHDAQWLVYIKCPSHLPGDSPVRDFLKNPIAHGLALETLFDTEWKARLPRTRIHQLNMSGSTERASSWRSRLGLPDYKEETVPATMNIHTDAPELMKISGEYEHLPRCGTACNSLYKKLSGESSMYLFLDPEPIGRPEHDSFVFSQDHSRKNYGDDRMTVARLDSSWRPWHMDDGCERLITTIVSDLWVPATIKMESAAAAFERAIKMRPDIFKLKAFKDSDQTRIQIGINIMSLIHRAQGRLLGHSSVSTSWRLLTDHFDLPSQPFAKFRLQSNSDDSTESHQIVVPPKYLLSGQMKSLAWMVTQELGTRMSISETEESVHSGLGWRVEARAEAVVCVRGGVLADQPSFGKTVTTIALIQSEFDQYTQEQLIQNNQELAAKLPELLESAATLVVCPPQIALQWRTELERFLDKDQFQWYNVVVVENFAQLTKLTIDDLLRSRVIVVAWDLFFDKEYISELADFTAMPEPTLVSTRAFDAWMTRATNEIPSQLVAYQTHAYKEFQEHTKDLIESRLQHADFKATIPIRIQHGSAYKSYSTTQSGAETINTSETKARSSTRTRLVPLLHLFRFNRVVIDEYHYLNDGRKVENAIKATAIKAIGSYKRWILSGTPALENFSDVNQIASFLGIRLGRHFFGDGIVSAGKKAAKLDQTDVESFLSQTEIMSRQWHQARHERAQEFLDKFVRQNEAELQDVACTERLLPVGLDTAHHAVYLELSQHLISQRMQIKRLNNKSSSDRTERLNDSLDNSSTAEEALLKSALLFETEEDGQSGLELLIEKRADQLASTKINIRNLLVRFEHLMLVEKKARKKKKATGEADIVELYGHFRHGIAQNDCLGDQEASQSVRSMLAEGRKDPCLNFSQLRGKDEKTRLQIAKQLLSQLKELCLELTHRTRSKRFIASLQDILQSATQETTYRCSSPSCKGVADVNEIFSIPHCGHTACQSCLETRSDDEGCVHPGCKARTNEGSLIPMANLGLNDSDNQAAGQSFGKKLDAIVQLVVKMPAADYGIVFAPNEETMRAVEKVLIHHLISYYSTRNKRIVSKAIEDFKANENPEGKKKLLVLNLASESAAGVNLTKANHVIFVSPLHAENQHNYESTMAQAIARSRRFGQKKTVHIYHVVALRTIDVDILEHRHRRCEAMLSVQSQSNTTWPELSTKKEKVRLVRGKHGELMLVPCSWLEDEHKRNLIDVNSAPERFTSLIDLSATFGREDE
ncbi:hypothetical protein GMOD_00006426 [Pyrenophora seminiperda CCB06]|uniref:SNF2 N-terminal domain-containing protein n=1 Tax=Pyrenophora seminiperda CCB06 TaxID=1302712 RepID=A0A3M7M525_9PLEO|nr:hypothetical protein GMOD_00006426 [Pyrenophora seminiperda CCB06]